MLSRQSNRAILRALRRSSSVAVAPAFSSQSFRQLQPRLAAVASAPVRLSVQPTRSFSTESHKDVLQEAFASAQANKSRPALVAYITAGFPSKEKCVEALLGLEDGGADIIELGIPFTDPLADGSTIQKANQIALEQGVTSIQHVLSIAKQAREKGLTKPLVLMGYFNPLLNYSTDIKTGRVDWTNLMRDCQAVGIKGFIVSDLPPEESGAFRRVCTQHGLAFIPLVAPTTTPDRIKTLVKAADSFIYAVSLTGITGARTELSAELPEFLQRLRSETSLPIAIGFGISTSEQYKSAGALGDGVVVGSAIINAIEKAAAQGQSAREAASNFCKQLLSGYPAPTAAAASSTSAATKTGRRAVSSQEETDTDSRQGFRFGEFGGRYVPETLVPALEQLDQEFKKAMADPEFEKEVRSFDEFIGRPSRLHLAERLTEYAGGAKIWLKREDLNHTGAHKINNAVAQALLAKRLGKPRIIAETGAGQHGVASATICAKLGLDLTVYMGAEDVARQALNVFRMQMLGAKVHPVTSGSRTLKDAINEAMRDWVTNIRTTHYLVGSVIGPHPFPTIVRDFQSVIGREARRQMISLTGRLPDAVVACVGGGSNAIGTFYPFMEDKSVRLIGVEAGGSGVASGKHSATLSAGRPGVLHGTRTYLLQDDHGQIIETHSISAGLDYPGVGPEHAHLKDIGRAEYVAVDDKGCLEGFLLLAKTEGIIPALETAHAVKYVVELARSLPKDQNVLLCVSGRGDKDVDAVRKYLPEFGLSAGPEPSSAPRH